MSANDPTTAAAAASAVAAAPPPPAAGNEESKDVIILLDDEDDEGAKNLAAVQYMESIEEEVKQSKQQKKQARKRKRNKQAATAAEAIDIDGDGGRGDKQGNSTPEEDRSSRYRQVLGPIRFDFVPKLSHHTHAMSKPRTTCTAAELYRELLEYQLNLPVEVNSAVFVRAVESRMDLLRVLITGAF